MWVLETTLFGSGITSFRIIGARFGTRGGRRPRRGSLRQSAPRTRVLRPIRRREFGSLREPVVRTRPSWAGGKNGLQRSDYRERRDGRRPRARARGAAAPRAVGPDRRRARPRGAVRPAFGAPAGEPRAARAARPLDLFVARQLAGAQEHGVCHRLGELAGERVLLARVEAAEQHRAAVHGLVLRAVPELGAR